MSSQPKQSWGGKVSLLFALEDEVRRIRGRTSIFPPSNVGLRHTPGTTFPASTCRHLNTCFYPPPSCSKPPFLFHLSSSFSPSLHVSQKSHQGFFVNPLVSVIFMSTVPLKYLQYSPVRRRPARRKMIQPLLLQYPPPPNVALQKHADLSNGPNSCLLHSPT